MYHLAEAGAGEELTAYHLQAGIAACHTVAKEYESTDWGPILSLYDRLLTLEDSPVVALNRAVAVAEVHGPQAGIDAVEAVRDLKSLGAYYLLYAVLGEFEARLGHTEIAASHYQKALELAGLDSEKAFLTKRLKACEERGAEA